MATITNKQVKIWTERFRRNISKTYQPQKIILFGSRARGDHLVDSDVDVVIVSSKFVGVPWPRRIGNVAKLWPGLIEIEPLCYTPEEFNSKKKQIGIVQQAVKEGIEIQ